MMTRTTWLAVATPALLLGLMAIGAPAAQAQLSARGGPISYSADNLEYMDGNRQLVLTGNVDVVQDDSRLQSDKLTLYFAAGSTGGNTLGTGDIERIVAEGQVYYVRPDQKARGDRAVYETASDSVTFSGNVVVASDENVIRGDTLVLEISAGRTTIRSATGGTRPQGVFRPSQRPKKQ
jgi:lipopolysaccharide export system protein LptA